MRNGIAHAAPRKRLVNPPTSFPPYYIRPQFFPRRPYSVCRAQGLLEVNYARPLPFYAAEPRISTMFYPSFPEHRSRCCSATLASFRYRQKPPCWGKRTLYWSHPTSFFLLFFSGFSPGPCEILDKNPLFFFCEGVFLLFLSLFELDDRIFFEEDSFSIFSPGFSPF